MATLNETPSSNRLHIGVFGKTNSGKSTFINNFANQKVSIVSDIAGTTTDPVYKSMEIRPLGPCVLIDTAGFDDKTVLGEKRLDKTRLAMNKSDVAIILVEASSWKESMIIGHKESFDNELAEEAEWYNYFKEKKTPVLFVVSKADICRENAEKLKTFIEETLSEQAIIAEQTNEIDNVESRFISSVKTALARLLPEDFGAVYITGNLVTKDDVVLLVMPQDIQAPKGRLILPQVQTIRELLDKKCTVISATTDQMISALSVLKQPPKLIITDSQVFKYVYEHKPKESMLTSFSVLFAAYKGDLPYYLEGAKAIDTLTENSKVLIAECCTHAPLGEDIGRVKIPAMLRKRVGESLTVDMVSGTDFPENLSDYDLIIQCGACMFNRKYVMSRIERARSQTVPMTNYGVTIAHVSGILEHVACPEP